MLPSILYAVVRLLLDLALPRCYSGTTRDLGANAVGERWVGTVRREYLDWLLILGRGHLEQVLREYVAHYNAARPHRALELRAPLSHGHLDRPTRPVEEVVRRDRLGGLIHEYEPVAA